MEQSPLEISLPSSLRTMRFSISTITSMLNPERCTPPAAITLLSQINRDLAELVPQVEALMDALRMERRARQASSNQAKLSRSLSPFRRRK